ncbi:MAG: GNAT family N-acetyltransferase [Gammaproteobacteria bacterium]|nr:GNAT family N-acetyltransferase [Gammaproteobacteria bacterium]MDH4315299.1 GNAT family N-acetyltransferase [Gammaproteobacteria bacterium]MDH5213414.1 GNAT family N-acetyltransferase [Gammaproteobacteria bacterium]MDH5502147.1 GNAT family N-acetyltransferase [Gammaproteobacteria bacterium]
MGEDNRITIRLADPQDAEAVHSMIYALAEALGDERKVVSTVEDLIEHGFSRQAAFEVLLAERNSDPMGICLFFYSFSTWRGALGVYIQDLYVSDQARGTGLGRRLVAETARIAATRGADHLRLTVDSKNTSAQAFYETLGMIVRDDELIYQASDAAFDALAKGVSGE